MHPGQKGDTSTQQPIRSSVTASSSQGEIVNTLVAKRKDKNRPGARRLNLMNNIPSAGSVPSASVAKPQSRANGFGSSSSNLPNETQRPTSSSSHRVASSSRANLPITAPVGSSYTTEGFGFDDVHMDDGQGNVSIAHLDTTSPERHSERQADEVRVKPRTLGGDRARENLPARQLGIASPIHYAPIAQMGETVLPSLPVMTVVSSRFSQGSSECVLEGKNSDTGGEAALQQT